MDDATKQAPKQGAATNNGNSSSPAPAASNTNKGFPVTTFIAGLVPGVIAGLILAAAIIYFCHRRRKAADRDSIFSKPDRQISDPIYNPQMATRTDFLNHKRGPSANTIPSADTPTANQPPLTGYYNPNRPETGTTAVASPPQGEGDFVALSTPTPKIRGLFGRSSDLKKKQSTSTYHRSANSQETIDVAMGNMLPPPLPYDEPHKSVNPYGWADSRNTMFSDVIKMAGGTSSQIATPALTPSPAKGKKGEQRPPLKLGSPYRGNDAENKF
jgi:hypothetical protein